MRRALLMAGTLLALLPSVALAGTINVEEAVDGKDADPLAYVFFDAVPGERNDLTFEQATDGSLYLRDDGAPLDAGAGCIRVDAHVARCHSQWAIISVFARTGDMDDRVVGPVTADSVPAFHVYGGDGADSLSIGGQLFGGAGADVLLGGSGADQLRGGPGDDVLRGGAGNDELMGDGDEGPFAGDEQPGGDDVLDGGPGSDTVSYAYRLGGVQADLGGPGPAGAPGERDTLEAVESLTGGRGPDVLAGDDAPNSLDGADGDDLMLGRGGADRLDDGGGTDTAYGGSGDDQVTVGEFSELVTANSDLVDRAFGGEGDDVLTASGRNQLLLGGPGDDVLRFGRRLRSAGLGCGSGDDTLAGQLDAQFVAAECEHAKVIWPDWSSRTLLGWKTQPDLASDVVSLRLTRPAGAHSLRRCSGSLRVHLRRTGHRKLLLGSRAFVVRPRQQHVVRVHVRRAARSALAGGDSPTLQLRLAATCGSRRRRLSIPFTRRWRVKLSRPALTLGAPVG